MYELESDMPTNVTYQDVQESATGGVHPQHGVVEEEEECLLRQMELSQLTAGMVSGEPTVRTLFELSLDSLLSKPEQLVNFFDIPEEIVLIILEGLYMKGRLNPKIVKALLATEYVDVSRRLEDLGLKKNWFYVVPPLIRWEP